MNVLSKEQVEEKIASNDNALLIDVLAEEYYKKEHIPGAINIPYDAPDFVEQVSKKVSSKDQEIIVYCYNTQCSASPQAAEKLEKSGYSKVYDFEGGIEAWKQKGGSVES